MQIWVRKACEKQFTYTICALNMPIQLFNIAFCLVSSLENQQIAVS